MYVENICMDVSPERLSRFFHRVEDHYQVNKTVRDICVFARHDIMKDPPFSRMDVASCRNMLIYMSPPLQRSVLERLHYALNPEGVLILGGSESALGHSKGAKKPPMAAGLGVTRHPGAGAAQQLPVTGG